VCDWKYRYTLYLKTFLSFITVAMAALYKSLVNYRSRKKVENNFMHTENYPWDLCFSGMLHITDL